MASIPNNPDVLLRRKALAEALSAYGVPITATTLATRATRGGGPPYRKYRRVPLYRWGDALAWFEASLSPPRCSTSEGDQREPSTGNAEIAR
jgi:hypothetical protein